MEHATNEESWWKRRSPLERRLLVTTGGSIAACFVLLIAVAFLSGAAFRSLQIHDSTKLCLSSECVRAASRLLKDMDFTVDPCDNFYQYSCGNFIKNSIIPDDKFGRYVSTPLGDKLTEQLRIAIEEPSADGDPQAFRLVKDVYVACINKSLVEVRKLKPVEDIIRRAEGWPVVEGNKWNENSFNWRNILYQFRKEGFHTNEIFTLDVYVDSKNSSKRIITLDEASLILPRINLVKGMDDKLVREYYKYQVDLAVIFGANRTRAQKEMREALDFEIQLANERRNFSRLYNPMKILELQEMFPTIPWLQYFRNMMPPSIYIDEDETITVSVPNFFTQLEKVLSQTPKRVLANYIMWRSVSSIADYLHEEVRNRQLEFNTALFGIKERKSRWKECVSLVSERLQFSTGSLYVRKYVDVDAKRETASMVAGIRQEMVKILETVDWMDDLTRNTALRKVQRVTEHIAYPDELLDNQKLDEHYSGLVVNPSLYLESVLNLTKFRSDFLWSRLRQPVNKTDWLDHSSIAVVNAFYRFTENSIELPAGILQGIYFSKKAPRYMNYGAIGSIIGHEITHGFDDMGRQFDDNGNLAKWWAKETQRLYSDKVRCIIEQYGNYTVEEVDMQLNGVNTQGENIADNGGFKQAYRAYTAWSKNHGTEPRLPGLPLSPQQLFWVSAAHSWCSKIRPETMRLQISTGEHSPPEFRVRGSFSNQKDFARDFNCPLGSNMNPVHKCEVW